MPSFNGVPLKQPVLSRFSPESFSAAGLRVAVVGGTGGLGRALAVLLAAKGAAVTVVGRTFRDRDVARLEFIAADLESVAEAQRVAAALPAEELDALIMTTGIITGPKRQVTRDNIEKDLAVSYVSRFVILRAVADRLGRNRPKRPRVFIMGFPGTGEAGNPDDLNSEQVYKQLPAHMQTVAANEALVLDAARRYPRLGVFGLNPGLIKTDIRANALGGNQSLRFKIVETLIGLFTPTPEQYARRLLPVLFAPELDGETGIHVNQKGVPIKPSAVMTDERVTAFVKATEALLIKKTTEALLGQIGAQ